MYFNRLSSWREGNRPFIPVHQKNCVVLPFFHTALIFQFHWTTPLILCLPSSMYQSGSSCCTDLIVSKLNQNGLMYVCMCRCECVCMYEWELTVMAKVDESKLNKAGYLLRNSHQSYDHVHTGRAVGGEGVYKPKWEKRHYNQATRIPQVRTFRSLWKLRCTVTAMR